MVKKLAIEWDPRELRVVAGTVRGDKVTITDIASTPIESTEPQALAETLRGLLHSVGLEKHPALIALGRGRAELRELKLPPVPDAELPDVVRFQAVRTFAAAGERAAIDYLPTRRDPEGVRVVAAAVAPEELKRCAQVAAPSGLAVERVVLRPLAAAALYRHSGRDMAGETVLIDLLADEADIVVLRDGTPAFVRSIRLPEDPAVSIRTLSGEVRRSLMACREGNDEGRARRIILWGRAEVHASEVAALSESLNTPVETLDPFSVATVDSKLRARLPEHVGRLAPLVGLLEADARNGDDQIDFLNPRRAPEPVSNRSRYMLIGGAAAALVLLILFFGWRKMANLDAEIAMLEGEYEQLADDVDRANDAIARTERIEQFLDGNVLWLEEIRRAVEAMPPADQAILERVVAQAARDGGGAIALVGGVTRSELGLKFEQALRDEDHRVVGKGTGLLPGNSPYDWSFNQTIHVDAPYVRRTRQQAEFEAAAAAANANAADATADDASASGTDASNAAPAPTEAAPTEAAPAEAAPTEAIPSPTSPSDRGSGETAPPGDDEPVEDVPADGESESGKPESGEPEGDIITTSRISAAEENVQ